ncbi:MAG: ABC transporter permease [Cycloclasticus sp.]|nr:MAG: ABC transporter permease [Cycloclasticus sp.]
MLFSLTVFNGLSLVSALIYLLGAILAAINITNDKQLHNLRQLVLSSAFAALFIHILLVMHSYNVNHIISNDFFSMLSLIFLVISLLFFVSAFTQPIESLAIIVFPFSALAVLLNFGNVLPVSIPVQMDGALQLHIILSVLSYSLLTVAAFQAVFLSIQEKQLHNQQSSRFIQRLPPLQLMETLLFRVISLGVFLLTFALVTGFVFLEDIFAQHIAHKTILSIFAWVVFATLLCGRHFMGWRGQQAVKWTYGGYAALMLAYFGSKFVLQLILEQS